ncbi:hypothetical protein KY348_01655 [Candidatus Woesearchaeota archaeon]|nr:hypothetical protein [Candidatus Woesearchaeota archaeon]
MKGSRFSRREFLKITGISAFETLLLSSIGLGSNLYLNNSDMIRPPARKNGKILVDLHAHVSSNLKKDEILDLLCEGVTGLASIYNRSYLGYDDVVQAGFSEVKEIDKGLFAEISYNGKTGYLIKVQEVMADHHILAVACEEKIDDYREPEKAIEEIKNKGGLEVLCHPGIIDSRKEKFKWRLANTDEQKRIKYLCEKVRVIETFSAFCNDFSPVINFTKVNKWGKELAAEYNLIGIAVSDAHYGLDQPRLSGIYISEDYLSAQGIKKAVLKNDFERFEKYTSRRSVLKGLFLKK